MRTNRHHWSDAARQVCRRLRARLDGGKFGQSPRRLYPSSNRAECVITRSAEPTRPVWGGSVMRSVCDSGGGARRRLCQDRLRRGRRTRACGSLISVRHFSVGLHSTRSRIGVTSPSPRTFTNFLGAPSPLAARRPCWDRTGHSSAVGAPAKPAKVNQIEWRIVMVDTPDSAIPAPPNPGTIRACVKPGEVHPPRPPVGLVRDRQGHSLRVRSRTSTCVGLALSRASSWRALRTGAWGRRVRSR